jgi:hypothetical protein
MATLNEYLKQATKFLHEKRQEEINPRDLIDYINQGRREIAERTQCVRRLTPIAGKITTAKVLTGGTGYTAPVVAISAPDFPSGATIFPNGAQAQASATQSGGIITAVNINFGGDGYFQPQVTISDPTGSGATASLTVVGVNKLNPGQESYNFSDIDVSMFPGIDSVYAIKSVSVIYANFRYSLPMYAFSVYQAKIRQYPFQYQFVPCFASQYGQGNQGSFYAYPIASQVFQWEFDCFCVPQDLTDNQSVDVIPKPWDDVVPYWAAYMGYLELQNFNAAKFYLGLFDEMTLRKSNYARVGRAVNPYGRY